MKNRLPALIFGVCCTALCFVHGAEYEGIAVTTIGKVDKAVVEQVRAYAGEQYRLRVDLLPGIDGAAVVEQAKERLVGVIRPRDACLLALAELPDLKHQGMVFMKERCGIVNVAALRRAGEEKPDTATLMRRVESESMRAIALMVGVEPCPFPRCALRQHQSAEELDRKSRNPCPPCITKVHDKLAELGILLPKEKPEAPQRVRPEDK